MNAINTYNIVDLFSGAGGLSFGFYQTGRIRIVAAAEVNSDARATYKRNFKVSRVYTDVRTIDYGELRDEVGTVDIVVGGPPCQGFSNANRQHTTIISMNNRLVKEYVRAVIELQPRAFVMENVAMLKSQIHRFMVEDSDLDEPDIQSMNLSDDNVEILPATSLFQGAYDFVAGLSADPQIEGAWTDDFYKIINVLYRYRINEPKFKKSLEKYQNKLISKLNIILETSSIHDESHIVRSDNKMARTLLSYIEGGDFNEAVETITTSILMQRAILKMKELAENKIHIYGIEENSNGIFAKVKSYSVRDYINVKLDKNYTLAENTLNAIDYGAPQRRERFIIVGISKELNAEFSAPTALFTEENYRTVRDAISDLQDITPDYENTGKYIVLPLHLGATGLEKELRGKLLYNHVTTQTQPTALARFKALKEGQNFHDLDASLKTTYSNAERTQNTIYMRLKYDEPCGTVVNVRKSMWIHPELDRAISIREAARLQTFPDSFIFEGSKDHQYQQIGNAVPPVLARAVASQVITALDSSEE